MFAIVVILNVVRGKIDDVVMVDLLIQMEGNVSDVLILYGSLRSFAFLCGSLRRLISGMLKLAGHSWIIDEHPPER